MKKTLVVLYAFALVASIVLYAWYWQANHAKNLLMIPIPRWVAGSSNVSYQIIIGKSQIKNYGTLWKRTEGVTAQGYVYELNMPEYTAEDERRYLKRHGIELPGHGLDLPAEPAPEQTTTNRTSSANSTLL